MADEQRTPGAFTRFFSILNENLWELVQLNFMFLLTCIPIITTGPALAALTACLSDMVHRRRRDEPVLPRYFAAFRSCFLPALPWGLALLAGTAILGLALSWYGTLAMTDWFYVPFMALSLLGLIFFLGITFHLFLLLPERVQMRTRQNEDSKEDSVEISQEENQPGTAKTPLLRTAVLHALARMKQTLAGLLIAFILLALQFLLLPATVPLILTLGLSVPGLIMAQACTEQTEDF